ncbi:hypothetical protein LJC17_03395 [Acholeplasma sp. OttesenSCG-928-E16]|nr:hypothetical protein [Acholeplasma sp. OttesenSCG-928-E16]
MSKLLKDKNFLIWIGSALLVVILTIVFIILYSGAFPANLKTDLDKFLKTEVKLENGEAVTGVNDNTTKYEITAKNKDLVIYESKGSHGYGTVEVWVIIDGETVSAVPKEIKESYGNTNYEVSTYYFIVNTLQNLNYKEIGEIKEFVLAGSTTSESNEASVVIVANVVNKHFGDDEPTEEPDDTITEIDESFTKITEGTVEIQAKYNVKKENELIGYVYEVVNQAVYQEGSEEQKKVAFSITVDKEMNITGYHIFKTETDASVDGDYYEHTKGNRIKTVEQFMDGMIGKALSVVAGYGTTDFINGTGNASATLSQTAVLEAIKVLYNKVGGN